MRSGTATAPDRRATIVNNVSACFTSAWSIFLFHDDLIYRTDFSILVFAIYKRSIFWVYPVYNTLQI